MCRYAPSETARGAHIPSPLIARGLGLVEASFMRSRARGFRFERRLRRRNLFGGRLRKGGGAPPPSELWQPVAQTAPPRPMALRVPGPVDQEGLAADLVAVNEAPVAAVLGIVAVVAHDEVGARGDHEGIARVEIPAVRGGHGGD